MPKAVQDRAAELVRLLDDAKLPILDTMTQYYTKGSFEKKRDMYLNAIKTTGPGVRYLIIHCGYNNEELQGITTSSQHARHRPPRVHRSEAIDAVKKSGVEVISWKQVSEMNGKKVAAAK